MKIIRNFQQMMKNRSRYTFKKEKNNQIMLIKKKVIRHRPRLQKKIQIDMQMIYLSKKCIKIKLVMKTIWKKMKNSRIFLKMKMNKNKKIKKKNLLIRKKFKDLIKRSKKK